MFHMALAVLRDRGHRGAAVLKLCVWVFLLSPLLWSDVCGKKAILPVTAGPLTGIPSCKSHPVPAWHFVPALQRSPAMPW